MCLVVDRELTLEEHDGTTRGRGGVSLTDRPAWRRLTDEESCECGVKEGLGRLEMDRRLCLCEYGMGGLMMGLIVDEGGRGGKRMEVRRERYIGGMNVPVWVRGLGR